MKVVQQRAKDSPLWAGLKPCVRGFQREECQTLGPVLCWIWGRFGQLQLQAGERGVGCLAPPPGSHRPATPVDQGVADSEGLRSLGGLLGLLALKKWVAVLASPGVPSL